MGERVIAGMIVLMWFCSCGNDTHTPLAATYSDTGLRTKIEALKKAAGTGDLVVRLGDDLISERVKYLNEKDYAFSHAGLIIETDGNKQVFHITPDGNYNDTIQVVSIDSFLNPAKNLSAALFRYELSTKQRDSLSKIIMGYKTKGVQFDRRYNMQTDDRMYCSEMIAKAVAKASAEQIHFRLVNVPKRMQNAVAGFLKAENISPTLVAETKILTVDNLYSMPECTLLASFRLKELPGQQ